MKRLLVLLLLSAAALAQQIDLGKDVKPGTLLPAGNTRTKSASITLSQPATSDSGLVQFKVPVAVTVTKISCSIDTGSATINFDVRDESAPNTPGSDVLASPLACSTSTGSTTSIAAPNVAANGILSLQVPAVASATVLRVHLYYQFQ